MANAKTVSIFTIRNYTEVYAIVQRSIDGFLLNIHGVFEDYTPPISGYAFAMVATDIPGFLSADSEDTVWNDGEYDYFFYGSKSGVPDPDNDDRLGAYAAFMYGDTDVLPNVVLGNSIALRGKVSAIEKKVDGLILTDTKVSQEMDFVVIEIQNIQGILQRGQNAS